MSVNDQYFDPVYPVYTSAAIDGLGALIILITGIASFSRLRRRQDPARNVVIWFGITFISLLVGYALVLTSLSLEANILSNIVNEDGLDAVNSVTYDPTNDIRAMTRISLVGEFFLYSGAAMMLFSITEAASGLSLIVTGAKLNNLRGMVYFIGLVAAVLALTTCIMGEIYYTDMFRAQDAASDDSDGGDFDKRDDDLTNDGLDQATVAMGNTTSILQGVTLIALLLGSLILLLGALNAHGKARRANILPMPRVAVFILAWTFFAIRLWSIANIIFIFAPATTLTLNLEWYLITDAIIDKLGISIVFVRLYSLVAMGEGGLWSSPESMARLKATQRNDNVEI